MFHVQITMLQKVKTRLLMAQTPFLTVKTRSLTVKTPQKAALFFSKDLGRCLGAAQQTRAGNGSSTGRMRGMRDALRKGWEHARSEMQRPRPPDRSEGGFWCWKMDEHGPYL